MGWKRDPRSIGAGFWLTCQFNGHVIGAALSIYTYSAQALTTSASERNIRNERSAALRTIAWGRCGFVEVIRLDADQTFSFAEVVRGTART